MSYRPICDTWLLARPKVKYYGAYPNGFLERARVFLPVTRLEPVLHVCGGLAKSYPTWATLCPNDVTVDIDPATKPDLVHDVRDGVPTIADMMKSPRVREYYAASEQWRGILIDRPYSAKDAEHYTCGAAVLPNLNKLLVDALSTVREGGRVGVLDYVFVRPPNWMAVKLIAKCNVSMGYGNQDRCYSVFERLIPK